MRLIYLPKLQASSCRGGADKTVINLDRVQYYTVGIDRAASSVSYTAQKVTIYMHGYVKVLHGVQADTFLKVSKDYIHNG